MQDVGVIGCHVVDDLAVSPQVISALKQAKFGIRSQE